MILNDRDRRVLEFISMCPTNSFIIQELFFPSLQTAQKRLNKLYDAKLVNRGRTYINQNYIYYIDRKPRQIEHTLYLSRLYAYWVENNYRVLKFKREIVLGSIRADAIAVVKVVNEVKTYLVEVELSNNPISKKIKAYDEFLLKECMDLLGFKPIILFITNKKIPSCSFEHEVLRLDHI